MPGLSWECSSGGHGTCALGDCRCKCHYTAAELTTERVKANFLPTPPNDAEITTASAAAGPSCPQCGRGPSKPGDKFCRADGSRLATPTVHCGHCGSECQTSDLHCGGCGEPLTAEITTQ